MAFFWGIQGRYPLPGVSLSSHKMPNAESSKEVQWSDAKCQGKSNLPRNKSWHQKTAKIKLQNYDVPTLGRGWCVFYSRTDILVWYSIGNICSGSRSWATCLAQCSFWQYPTWRECLAPFRFFQIFQVHVSLKVGPRKNQRSNGKRDPLKISYWTWGYCYVCLPEGRYYTLLPPFPCFHHFQHPKTSLPPKAMAMTACPGRASRSSLPKPPPPKAKATPKVSCYSWWSGISWNLPKLFQSWENHMEVGYHGICESCFRAGDL